MRICHIITRLIIGGAQENTILSCRGLHVRGHEVVLVAGPETGPEGSLWDEARAGGYRTVVVDSLRRAVHPYRDLRARRELHRLLGDIRPDIVHTHSSKAGILGRDAAARVGVPIIVHTIHGMSFNRTQSRFVQWVYRSLERRAARQTSRFVTVADAMTRQAVEAGLGPPDRFVTVRSGMDLAPYVMNAERRAEVRRSWGLGDEEIAIGTIARLFDNKGYEDVIAALPVVSQKCPRARFIWIGDGPRRSEFARRIAALGLSDRVRFLGLVPPCAIPRLASGFDLLVHASRWEGLPRAVVQALLVGVPVVTYDNDGAPEVVQHGRSGMVVPLGDVGALATAMVELVRYGDRRREYGRIGRERCLAEFDADQMVRKLEEIYLAESGLR